MERLQVIAKLPALIGELEPFGMTVEQLPTQRILKRFQMFRKEGYVVCNSSAALVMFKCFASTANRVICSKSHAILHDMPEYQTSVSDSYTVENRQFATLAW